MEPRGMTTIDDQPSPVPREGAPSVLALVRADLVAREQIGIERYGTTLNPHNGRDGIVDAYQEILDAAAYMRQVIEEGGTVGRHGADDSPRDPQVDDMTPGHLLACILDGDTKQRLELCGKMLSASRHSYNCLSWDHVGTIEHLREQVRNLSRALVRCMSGIPIAEDSNVAAYARAEASRNE
jgi:hypothetical protein